MLIEIWRKGKTSSQALVSGADDNPCIDENATIDLQAVLR